MTADQPRPDRRLVRDRVRRLDSGAFADFVAAVQSARGWTVEREDGLVVARDGDRTRRLLPVTVDRLGRPVSASDRRTGIDELVFAGDDGRLDWGSLREEIGGDPSVVDGTELVDTYLYGIDSTARERIARAHFGGPLRSIRPSLWWRAVHRIAGVRVPRRAGLAVVVAVLALVGVFAVQATLAGVGLDGGTPTESVPTTAAPNDSVTPVALTGTPPGSGVPPGSDGVPGVGPNGTVTIDRLLEAHSQRLTGRSYRITRSYRGPPADGSTIQTYLRSRRLATTPLRSLIEVRSTWENGSQRGTEDLYFDGRDWYRASYQSGSFNYGNASGAPELLVVNTDGTATLERYLRTSGSLAVTDRRTVNGSVRYRIVGEGAPRATPFAGATNYTVRATVGPDGLVYRLRATYRLAVDGDRVPVSVDWRLEPDEELVIDPPLWYQEEFGTPSPDK